MLVLNYLSHLILRIKGKINKEVFHLEINNGNNTKSTIEIHLKNPLEKDLTLEKGNKNV